jgi:hypothetical protein
LSACSFDAHTSRNSKERRNRNGSEEVPGAVLEHPPGWPTPTAQESTMKTLSQFAAGRLLAREAI